MNVLVIGGAGREHALVRKFKQSPRVSALFCVPGNPGIARLAQTAAIPISDHDALVKFVRDNQIDLTVVGPDDALAAGIVDRFQRERLRIFGPSQKAAQLESSKIFAKEFMQRHGIPTARSGHFDNSEEAHRFCRSMRYPVVIKADGLALGKGVVIAENAQTAASAIYQMMECGRFGEAGKRVVIEEFLRGQECSIHAIVDGGSYLLFPAAQDHKQAFDGDTGPNTGGMGTFSPAGLVTPEMEKWIRTEVLDRLMAGLRADGIEFKGLLFPGLMITEDGPKVLEFNCRFGDPETQVLLPRLKTDLVEIIEASIDGRLDQVDAQWDERAAVCVIMASGGYPGTYAGGKEIRGLDQFENSEDVIVFHAGTKLDAGRFVTAGGRVLGVTALGHDLKSARDRAYDAVSQIGFDGAHYRTDIAQKGLAG